MIIAPMGPIGAKGKHVWKTGRTLGPPGTSRADCSVQSNRPAKAREVQEDLA